MRVERCPGVRSAVSREHEGQSTTCATSSRKYAALSPSGQHMRPSSRVAKTLSSQLMVCYGTGIMCHHMRRSTSGAGSPELFWSLLVWSVAVARARVTFFCAEMTQKFVCSPLRTGSNPDSQRMSPDSQPSASCLTRTTDAFDPFGMFTPFDIDMELRADVGSVVSEKD